MMYRNVTGKRAVARFSRKVIDAKAQSRKGAEKEEKRGT
jgi:hypothetical protein